MQILGNALTADFDLSCRQAVVNSEHTALWEPRLPADWTKCERARGMTQRFSLDRQSFEQFLSAAFLVQQLQKRALQHVSRDDSQPLVDLVEIQQEIEKGALDLESMLNRIAVLANRLTGAKGSGIWLFKNSELVYRVGAGSASIDQRLTARILSQIAATAQLPQGTAHLDSLVDESEGEYPSSSRSLLVTPIYRSREVTGALAVFSDRACVFSSRDATNIRLLAGLVAHALDKAAEIALQQSVSLERAAIAKVIERLVPSLQRLLIEQDRERHRSPNKSVLRHNEQTAPLAELPVAGAIVDVSLSDAIADVVLKMPLHAGPTIPEPLLVNQQTPEAEKIDMAKPESEIVNLPANSNLDSESSVPAELAVAAHADLAVSAPPPDRTAEATVEVTTPEVVASAVTFDQRAQKAPPLQDASYVPLTQELLAAATAFVAARTAERETAPIAAESNDSTDATLVPETTLPATLEPALSTVEHGSIEEGSVELVSIQAESALSPVEAIDLIASSTAPVVSVTEHESVAKLEIDNPALEPVSAVDLSHEVLQEETIVSDVPQVLAPQEETAEPQTPVSPAAKNSQLTAHNSVPPIVVPQLSPDFWKRRQQREEVSPRVARLTSEVSKKLRKAQSVSIAAVETASTQIISAAERSPSLPEIERKLVRQLRQAHSSWKYALESAQTRARAAARYKVNLQATSGFWLRLHKVGRLTGAGVVLCIMLLFLAMQIRLRGSSAAASANSHHVVAVQPMQVSLSAKTEMAPSRPSHLQITDASAAEDVESLSSYEMSTLRRQAEYGDDVAAFELGMAYETGHGVSQSCAKAANWVERAANAGNRAAEYNLGLRFRDGDGVTKNADEAEKWLDKARKRNPVSAKKDIVAVSAN